MNQRVLFVVNEAPYGSERTYNALRHANAVASSVGVVQVFFIGDGVGAARRGQQTPNGYYNVERMLRQADRAGVVMGACGSCMDARGLEADALVPGAHRSSMDELAAWTVAADQVLIY